ncbi:MAG: hypothetical protein HC923_06495 [Myxococcales bacterium]|nr:hypothetical protein [Myxococcales bacterium]
MRDRIERATLLAWIVMQPLGPTRAQDTSVDIDFGRSTRVGGDGILDEDIARSRREDAPREPVTEETLPAPGHPKRLEGLFEIADRHVGGQLWSEACMAYDRLLDEAGTEAVRARDRGPIDSGRAYLECAKDSFQAGDFDRTEVLLTKSESLMGSSGRHDALRRKMLVAEYRKKMMSGDTEGAFAGYQTLLKKAPDLDDERLWFAEELAKAAWASHEEGDVETRDRLMTWAKQVSPMNVELRRLEKQLGLQETVGMNILTYGLGGIALVGLLAMLSSWRARARVRTEGGSAPRRRKNPFLDDEDELA